MQIIVPAKINASIAILFLHTSPNEMAICCLIHWRCQMSIRLCLELLYFIYTHLNKFFFVLHWDALYIEVPNRNLAILNFKKKERLVWKSWDCEVYRPFIQRGRLIDTGGWTLNFQECGCGQFNVNSLLKLIWSHFSNTELCQSCL